MFCTYCSVLLLHAHCRALWAWTWQKCIKKYDLFPWTSIMHAYQPHLLMHLRLFYKISDSLHFLINISSGPGSGTTINPPVIGKWTNQVSCMSYESLRWELLIFNTFWEGHMAGSVIRHECRGLKIPFSQVGGFTASHDNLKNVITYQNILLMCCLSGSQTCAKSHRTKVAAPSVLNSGVCLALWNYCYSGRN